jgi:hypothetical protein
MKYLSQDSLCPGRDPTQKPLEYKSRAVLLDQPVWFFDFNHSEIKLKQATQNNNKELVHSN